MIRRHFKKRHNHRRPTWREYQDQLASIGRSRRPVRRFGVVAAGLLLLSAGLYGLVGAIVAPEPDLSPPAAVNRAQAPAAADGLLNKTDVQDLLATEPVANLTLNRFNIQFGDRKLNVETTIDPALQSEMTDAFDKRHSQSIAVVVMNAVTGEILAMAGYDRSDPNANPCIGNQYPAASIFKIVTAAAAIETRGMTAGTPLTYNGASHTLYKSQLKDRQNRWTRKTTLRDSFAKSVNPVFGKLGVHYLGKEALERYGDLFGFNQKIQFEAPVGPSQLKVAAESYNWAEVASGFNQETRISPLHGALIAACLVNSGAMMEPTIIRRVTDASGRELYRSRSTRMKKAVEPGTSTVLKHLMSATINKGTARKLFRGYRKNKTLAEVNIGGKTGSIDNQTHDARLDWFVGYAEGPGGRDKIALAAVVAHEEYIGKRAATYARNAISAYFEARAGS